MAKKVVESNLAEALEKSAKDMRNVATQLEELIDVVKEFHTDTDRIEIMWQVKHLLQHAEQLEFIAYKHRKKFE